MFSFQISTKLSIWLTLFPQYWSYCRMRNRGIEDLGMSDRLMKLRAKWNYHNKFSNWSSADFSTDLSFLIMRSFTYSLNFSHSNRNMFFDHASFNLKFLKTFVIIPFSFIYLSIYLLMIRTCVIISLTL